MYAAHFNLALTPFSLTPDTRFYVGLPQHEAALAVLNTALAAGEGFIKVTGEVGTGKTLLCRLLLKQAQADWQLAYLPDPSVSPLELRWALAAELGLKYSANIDASQLLQLLQRQLILLAQSGKKIILVIDEAQGLPDDTLESLRLLTNLETEQRKLLQVVLFGQPELDQRLASQQFRQLRQRISFSYVLPVMSPAQIRFYVRHRLQVAGATPALFNSFALHAIGRYSRGIPRLVNLLAHKGLMLAYGEGKSRVTGRHIRFAAEDTEDTRRSKRRYLWLLGAAAVFSAACVGWMWR